ncbi:hypothetical protein EJB05_46576 [Eragrostis curvula]|uniref:RRM domain-containing protein n=1 Tax=Eragrostis curvula TaxID=38414 RepID=A0A5J9SGX5_9POAL|nr:hypothetical protein EJB05_56635 [Eragrostis curvula]TVU12910.1 hypothetical protein EJB05_46576 [Eragrostis curvula]
MADAYWRYAADPRQQQPPPPAGPHPGAVGGGPQAVSQMGAAGVGQQPMKRPRPADFSDVPGAPDMTGYYPRDEERAAYRAARDSEALNASYERFLRTGQIQSYGAAPGGEPMRPAVGGNAGYPVDDRPMMAARGMDNRNIGYGGGMPEPSLPPDASNTLFIEGVPTGCSRREVSRILEYIPYLLLCSFFLLNIVCILFWGCDHACMIHLQLVVIVPSLLPPDIFRPFVGFREVRLVNKEPKHPGGDPICLCFVDFADAAQAAIALEALQGEIDKLGAISLTNMIAIRPICAFSLLVLRVQGGIQDLVALVLGVKFLAFLLPGD